MLRKMAAIIVMLSLLLTVAAYAEEKPVPGDRGGASVQWWPGEGPAKNGPNTPRNVIQGTVTNVDANRVTLQTQLGELAFTVNDATRVMVRGTKSKITDIKSGDFARIEFALEQDNSRLARAVIVQQPRIAGKITAVSKNGFTLTNMDTNKTWNVSLTDDTKILSRRYVGTVNDLQVGYRATIAGEESNGSVVAQRVEFMPTVIKGAITQVNGNQLQVETLRHVSVTVSVEAATKILIMPRTQKNVKSAVSELQAGMPVNIGGHSTGEATLKALWIDVIAGAYENNQNSPGPITGPDNATDTNETPK